MIAKIFLATLVIATASLAVIACDQVVCHNRITYGQMSWQFGSWRPEMPLNDPYDTSITYTYRNDSRVLTTKIINRFVPYSVASQSFFTTNITFNDIGLARFLRASKYLPLSTTTQGFITGTSSKYQPCLLTIFPAQENNDLDASVVYRIVNHATSAPFTNIRFDDTSVLYGV